MENFFETTGRFFFKKKNFYFFLLLIFLIIITLFSVFNLKMNRLNYYEKKIEHTRQLSKKTLKKRWQRQLFLEKHLDADTDYIQKTLEPLVFLAKELHGLEALQKHPAFSRNVFLLERLEFLKKNNTLCFQNESLRKTAHLIEVEENQIDYVEMSANDLKNVLFLVEGSSGTKKPQMIIKQFNLKKTSSKSFEINMKIIQRNFLKNKL